MGNGGEGRGRGRGDEGKGRGLVPPHMNCLHDAPANSMLSNIGSTDFVGKYVMYRLSAIAAIFSTGYR